ncbi:MAG: TolB family protein [Actinomycetota bacterium]
MTLDLRQRLIAVADQAPQPASMPPELLRRVRGRQVRTIAVRAAFVAILVAGAVGGIRALRSLPPTPAHPPTHSIVSRAAGDRITVYGPSGVEDVDPDGVLAPFAMPLRKHAIPLAWSPDGTRLLLVHWRADGAEGGTSSDLAVFEPDGTWTELTRDGAAGYSASWSPDGSSVVYVHAGREIVTQDADGSGTPRVLLQAGSRSRLGMVAWSPDGSTIAFTEHGRLWRMASDGTGARPLLPTTPLVIETVAVENDLGWSPDGTRLLFSGSLGGGIDRIFVVGADGSHLESLTGILPTEMTPAFSPVWSPDGARIYFVRDDGIGGLGPTLHVMDADGTHVRDLEVAASKYSFAIWHPRS